MPARAIWKGFLNLSLVSIPVKAYNAIHSPANELRLNQLHSGCNSRVKYKKTCPVHGDLKQEEIVSGHEFAKDQYVIIDVAELDKLRTEESKAITIQEFVPAGSIDPVYFSGTTHYLLPDGPVAENSYAVVNQAMADEKRVGIAEVVWHGRERVVLIRPMDGLFAMSTLSFAAEVTEPQAFADETPKVDIQQDQLKLAKTLITSSTPKKIDLTKYKDTYHDKLAELIRVKVAGEEIVAVESHGQTKIIDLMEALQKSVEQAQGKSKEEDKPTLKIAAPETKEVEHPGPIISPSKKSKSASRKKKSS